MALWSPSWTHGGKLAVKPVAPAGYAYMLAAISIPCARAASILATAWAIFGQFFSPAAFR
jgi:hypothetical protein